MRIATIATFTVLALLASGAQAQVRCWTTQDGKRQCGATPPPGVKTTTINAPAAPATPAAPAAPAAAPASAAPAAAGAAAKKPAAKPPADPAEKQKAAEKEKQAQELAEAKKQNCESARNALLALESGQRISRIGQDGERFFLDEQQIAQETARAREIVAKNCTT